jgi:hypothetical protein
VCPHCRLMAGENERLTEDLSGLLDTTRRQGNEIVGLKNALAQADVDHASNAQVQCLLLNWMHLCRGRTPDDKLKGRRPIIAPGSARWKIARAALREHTVQECLEAIEGLAALPYVGAHGRKADGKPSERFDDLEYALKDETFIEKARKYRARALGASERALFDAWRAAEATQTLYLTAWLGKWNRLQVEDDLVAGAGWGQVIDITTARKAAA